ncbi:hypothetical protein AURDEDRAFT_163666 [Auricularia subglabra TFB-10046 SS5]|nr:hypothetical protein AURDEDRAFT_163666 [Auricularia subglabra TFB-10046 SS5]
MPARDPGARHDPRDARLRMQIQPACAQRLPSSPPGQQVGKPARLRVRAQTVLQARAPRRSTSRPAHRLACCMDLARGARLVLLPGHVARRRGQISPGTRGARPPIHGPPPRPGSRHDGMHLLARARRTAVVISFSLGPATPRARRPGAQLRVRMAALFTRSQRGRLLRPSSCALRATRLPCAHARPSPLVDCSPADADQAHGRADSMTPRHASSAVAVRAAPCRRRGPHHVAAAGLHRALACALFVRMWEAGPGPTSHKFGVRGPTHAYAALNAAEYVMHVGRPVRLAILPAYVLRGPSSSSSFVIIGTPLARSPYESCVRIDHQRIRATLYPLMTVSNAAAVVALVLPTRRICDFAQPAGAQKGHATRGAA